MDNINRSKKVRPKSIMAPVTEEVSRSLTLKERHKDFLKRESKRIKTFARWPVSFLKATDLAKDGFYYTNLDDVVKCAFCKAQIGYWEEGDDPHRDHQRLSPNCPFLKNEPCGNVPLSDDAEEDQGEDESGSKDVCGIYPLQIRPFSGPERSSKNAFSIDNSNLWKDFKALGDTKIREPVAPHYAFYEHRLRTFDKWTNHDVQVPEKLAEAGFYYTGEEDNVLCFHCGGGLKNWEKGEDPWEEHARWFHKCHFLILQKGREFIHNVLLKKKAFLTAETARKILENSNVTKNHSTLKNEKVQSEPIPASSKCASFPSCSSNTGECASKDESKIQQTEKKEAPLCTVCCIRERELVFLPCGHFVCCAQCTTSLSKCAVCRDPFKATIRAYLC